MAAEGAETSQFGVLITLLIILSRVFVRVPCVCAFVFNWAVKKWIIILEPLGKKIIQPGVIQIITI